LKAYIAPHWFKFTIPTEPTDTELDSICAELFGYQFRQFDKLYKCRDKYRDCWTLAELVSIYRNGWMDNKGTTCFDISGTGLDTLGLDIAKLGKFVLSRGGNICRIDLAALDTEHHLPYGEIMTACLADNFKSRVRTRFNRGKANAPKIELQPVKRILFGSEQSDNYVVLYDRQKTENLDFPCICIEQRITNRADCAAIIEALQSGIDAGSYFAGLLRGKLEFLEESTRLKRLRQPEKWWTDFLGDCERRKIKRTARKIIPWRQITRDTTQAIRHVEKLQRRGDHDGLETVVYHAQSALFDLKKAA